MYKRIGVIGAMDEEIEILKKILESRNGVCRNKTK